MARKTTNNDLPRDGMTRDYLYEIIENDERLHIRIVSVMGNKKR
jgi:hypothetical protein